MLRIEFQTNSIDLGFRLKPIKSQYWWWPVPLHIRRYNLVLPSFKNQVVTFFEHMGSREIYDYFNWALLYWNLISKQGVRVDSSVVYQIPTTFPQSQTHEVVIHWVQPVLRIKKWSHGNRIAIQNLEGLKPNKL